MLHQPGNSLVDYKSSEARVVPARQREESRSCGRNGNPSWHFSPFIKSSSVAALHACPLQSVRRFSGQTGDIFFLSTQESENLFRSQTVGCCGRWRVVRFPPPARSFMSVCKQQRQQWTEALLFTCELVTPVFFYISALHKLAAGREEKKRERARGGISETVQIKVDLLSWDIFI